MSIICIKWYRPLQWCLLNRVLILTPADTHSDMTGYDGVVGEAVGSVFSNTPFGLLNYECSYSVSLAHQNLTNLRCRSVLYRNSYDHVSSDKPPSTSYCVYTYIISKYRASYTHSEKLKETTFLKGCKTWFQKVAQKKLNTGSVSAQTTLVMQHTPSLKANIYTSIIWKEHVVWGHFIQLMWTITVRWAGL